MLFLLISAIVVGFYMAWNIGANDVANAMGTSVGSKSVTFRQAVVLAAIFEFLGAVLVGSHVSETVRKGIIDPMQFAHAPHELAIGMFAALLASALWLNVATYFGQPVSTTHSIVGSVVGVGLIGGGAIHWTKLASIVASWFISPVVSGVMAFLVFSFISRKILGAKRPGHTAEKYAPFFVVLVAVILTLSLIYKGLKNLHLDWSFDQSFVLAAVIGIVAGFFSKGLFRKIHSNKDDMLLEEELVYAESFFKYLQVVTACFVAFAHGANDVANAVGPVAAVYEIAMHGKVAMNVEVPVWILVMGGVGIIAGLATFGRRVIMTVGEKITEITPSRGFSAEIAAATTVLVCSLNGLPVSTTHALIGGVVGVGLARGLAGLQIKTIQQVFTSWFATIPIAAGLTMVIFLILKLFIA